MAKTRILFVDDEPNIIDGLRRMLRKQRDQWDMEFASDAPTALAKLAATPFDVIVTDLQMPGMDGADLLERVVRDYPGTARLVLSGHADEKVTKRALTVAHQFLAKPVDSDTLTAAVAEACGAQQTVQDDKLRALIGGCAALPSAPELYMELTRAVESDTADANTIGGIIARDMAITAKLLQLVNSSFFGLARRVSSIEQTVSLLGVMRIKALVLTENIFRQFAPKRQIPQLPVTQLWDHSIRVAELAREICRLEKQSGDRPDQAFTAGLLHDIGLLMLASRQPEAVLKVIELAIERQLPAHLIEPEVLGATHGEVGAYLLRLWRLPPRIVEAVSFHHSPGQVAYDGLCAVTVVHAADVLDANEQVQVGQNETKRIFEFELDQEYLARIGMNQRVSQWGELASGINAKQAGLKS